MATRAPDPQAGPDSPTDFGGHSWRSIGKRVLKEFQADELTDRAAALTYYSVLSIFPGLLVVVSVLGLFGKGTIDRVEQTIGGIAPGTVEHVITTAIDNVKNAPTAGLAAAIGIVVAFWSASGYIGAFMRASNAIYDVPEGRPVWKTLPTRLAITAVVGILLIVSALIVVFTGNLARSAGNALNVGATAVTVWNIAKWPVLIILVSLMFAILYWASPNAKHGGFRWISPGGILAIVAWLIASGLFAVYVANFGSYNKTYGSFAAVIIFLIWLWISNIAILFGAELDAELERERAVKAGHPEDVEPYVQLRDDRKLKKD
jgi:membrane protein